MTQYKRIAIGIAAALGLHLLLLAWLAPRKQGPNKIQAFEVLLLGTDSAGNVQPQRADAAASERPGTVPVRRRTATRERPDGSAPVLPATERAGTTSAVSGSPGLSLVLKEPLSVSDSGTGARAEGATQTRSPAQETAEQKATVERRIGSWVADVQAAQRLEVPDVVWREAATVLEQGFRPNPDMFEQNPAPPDPGPTVPAGVNSLHPRVDRSHASLNDDVLALPNEARGLESVSLAGAPRSSISLGNIAGLIMGRNQRRRSAVVSIAHRTDGSVSTVTLTAGSGSAAYDRLALAQARLLNPVRYRERRPCRSVWVFETELTKIPTTAVRSHVHLAALD